MIIGAGRGITILRLVQTTLNAANPGTGSVIGFNVTPFKPVFQDFSFDLNGNPCYAFIDCGYNVGTGAAWATNSRPVVIERLMSLNYPGTATYSINLDNANDWTIKDFWDSSSVNQPSPATGGGTISCIGGAGGCHIIGGQIYNFDAALAFICLSAEVVVGGTINLSTTAANGCTITAENASFNGNQSGAPSYSALLNTTNKNCYLYFFGGTFSTKNAPVGTPFIGGTYANLVSVYANGVLFSINGTQNPPIPLHGVAGGSLHSYDSFIPPGGETLAQFLSNTVATTSVGRGVDNRLSLTAVDASAITIFTTITVLHLYRLGARIFGRSGTVTSGVYTISWIEGGVTITKTLSITAVDTDSDLMILIQPDVSTAVKVQLTTLTGTSPIVDVSALIEEVS